MVLALLMFIGGIGLTSYPWVQQWKADRDYKDNIEIFESEMDNDFMCLKKDMQTYNTMIYENGQSGLKDAWSYEDSVFSLDEYGIENDMVGILEIAAMNIKLPLYLGASEKHLSQGATVLGQTSMPIGGAYTNCVIAGHRGYKGTSMFRDIEVLKIGDEVKLHNLWETLHYRVYKIDVIDPHDIDAVKIKNEHDMLTLMTCHPYRQNHHRYVVYCIRDDQVSQENEVIEESSLLDIQNEKHLSILGFMISILCLLIMIRILFIEYRKSKY